MIDLMKVYFLKNWKSSLSSFLVLLCVGLRLASIIDSETMTTCLAALVAYGFSVSKDASRKDVIKCIIVVLLLGSCTPEMRLAHILKRHPELLKKDTLLYYDTTIVKGLHTDSNFYFTGDTVRIHKDRQEIKYYYNTTTHKNYISGDVKADTITKIEKIPYEKTIVLAVPWYEKPAFIIFTTLAASALLVIVAKRI